MGKKDAPAKTPSSVASLEDTFQQLTNFMLRKKTKQLKDFVWKQHKEGHLSVKAEALINKYLNNINGEQGLQDQIDEKLEESEKLYCKTRKIFKGRSLKQKYSNLLQGKIEQQPQPQKHPLTQQQSQKLEQVNKIFGKYRVSSMFRDSLVRKVKAGCLDSLVEKGYLRETKSKEYPGATILYLSS